MIGRLLVPLLFIDILFLNLRREGGCSAKAMGPVCRCCGCGSTPCHDCGLWSSRIQQPCIVSSKQAVWVCCIW
ncbi:uncharacterized protein LY79DRAFT_567316 [Colletotrichum navitas]|uniref:Secreted protein n=1 Tax=Colletotrichum navitas TaxID=681940 RepID=A0AAD8UZU0_9PEZI|nr:uncharacterized protein LY79DRAFT_567316 [Colletotrichum navitas]KAK1574017.1 hypothetical protein LY79DRAFT_567316 [Colletotrichum navitas]